MNNNINDNPADLAAEQAAGESAAKIYLGVDWGEKRIGLAMADSETEIALPLKTVATLAELLEVIETEKVTDIIVGRPQKMSGAEADNPAWKEFVRLLEDRSGMRLIFVDERLSSLAADALEGNKNEKAERDEVAATLILQDYLDRA